MKFPLMEYWKGLISRVKLSIVVPQAIGISLCNKCLLPKDKEGLMPFIPLDRAPSVLCQNWEKASTFPWMEKSCQGNIKLGFLKGE